MYWRDVNKAILSGKAFQSYSMLFIGYFICLLNLSFSNARTKLYIFFISPVQSQHTNINITLRKALL